MERRFYKTKTIPTDYIAYVQLNEYKASANTGQTLTYSNVTSSNFKTYGNIPCVDMTSSSAQYIRLTEPTINQGTGLPRSYSVWLAMTYAGNGAERGIAIGSFSNGKELLSPNTYAATWEICAGGHSHDFRTGVNMTSGRWYHFVQQNFADGTLELWLDGVRIYNGSYLFDINNTMLSIGCPTNSTSYSFRGYAAAARLWNRTLTEEEIQLLAGEFAPHYAITANDLNFSLYQKSESYSISYSSAYPVTFEIIEGTLPSTISFNTSTGQFTGKGLTDADHTYTLKVRLTAENSDPAECTVTIHTYMTARISLSNQSFSFISNKAESKSMTYTSDETVTFAIESGTLPAGMTLSGNRFYSNGQNTSAETQAVVIRATSAHNQTGVTATMTLTMQMNAIVCNAQTFKFYTDKGSTSKTISYSGSLNTVSDAIFSMTGTLPAGVTFDSSTGAFTSDGTQSADETASVSVTVSSSNGTSTAATATITLEVHEGAPAIPNDYVFYQSFNTSVTEPDLGGTLTVINNSPTLTTEDGIRCARFNGDGALGIAGGGYVSTSNTVATLSVWEKFDDLGRSGSVDQEVFAVGRWSKGNAFYICIQRLSSTGDIKYCIKMFTRFVAYSIRNRRWWMASHIDND